LHKKLNSLISLKEEFKIEAEIDINTDFIYLTNEKCNQINSVNKTNFLKDETQCDFIKIKINELKPKPKPKPKNFDNINNIIYAVAK
jgi:hypothetical protein